MRKVKGEYIFSRKELKELISQCYESGSDNPHGGTPPSAFHEKYARNYMRWQMDCLDKGEIRIEIYSGNIE